MITVIGSINLDLVANVERLPGPGETVPGTAFVTSPGGKGANQALAARRAGATVRMIGAVGDDGFARAALDLLKRGGVDLDCVRRASAPTGTALILVAASGENMIAVVPGANDAVGAERAEEAGMDQDDIVLLQHEIPLATVEAALDAAARAGAVAILNTAPFRAEAAPFLAKAGLVVANETEFDLYAQALGLVGEDREARMREFSAQTGRTLIVTLGGEGVLAAEGGDLFHTPATPITPVDTVGAGDTFCGYLAAGLDAGLPLRAAIAQAARAASLACLKPGAQPSIPTADEVEAFTAGRSAP